MHTTVYNQLQLYNVFSAPRNHINTHKNNINNITMHIQVLVKLLEYHEKVDLFQ